MPASEDNREIRFPRLHRSSDFDRFANHRTSHERNCKAKRVLHLFKNPFFIIWSNRGIYEPYRKASPEQGRCHRQNPERRSGFGARKGRKKENYFFGHRLCVVPNDEGNVTLGATAFVKKMS